MGGVGSGRKQDPERQRLALKLRAQGFTLRQIGERLGMSHQGVRSLLIATGKYQPVGKGRRKKPS